jgi:hypothetical protein
VHTYPSRRYSPQPRPSLSTALALSDFQRLLKTTHAQAPCMVPPLAPASVPFALASLTNLPLALFCRVGVARAQPLLLAAANRCALQ